MVFNRLGDDGSFWGAIVEKMLAKWWGNYEHTVGGYMDQAVSALNGSPAEWMNNHQRDWSTGEITAKFPDAVWAFINGADQDHDIITAGSPSCGSNGDQDSLETGVACSHAYTVIHTCEPEGYKDENNDQLKMVLMRNPWGSEQYN